ncbi:MAG TPA: SAM-dependent methyltransferase [Acidobacteria bacterium]|nr:SAM-dependent methyltransferase [Acidobacteriota bacterium]
MSPIDFAERGLLPEALIRYGIRRLLRQRLREIAHPQPARRSAEFADALRTMPIAINTTDSKEQHYEVPTRFYELCLGPRLKYSSCLYATGRETLAAAEEAMLALTCERARLDDGQRILELGCGWGSLTLWMAEKYPRARITGVSHSRTQREHILAQAARRGLGNVNIITCDMREFDSTAAAYDRVVSVEMFEHVRNYAVLLDRIASWLLPGGHLFVHVFCHRELTYAFEDNGPGDWMARHFFTDGLMPAAGLLPAFQGPLTLTGQWPVSGVHYQKTSEAWLQNLDASRGAALALFEQVYGRGQGRLWLERWRIFFLACAELFGAAGGDEWRVQHYLFTAAR